MECLGLDEVIDSREMDVECHACHTTNLRTLGWMRNRHETQCDCCGELIVLGTAELRSQMRNTERLLRVLGEQLSEQLRLNPIHLNA
jgi:ribosomal protein S27E